MDAIFFDIDDTLYDLAQPYLRAYETVYGDSLGIDAKALFARSRVHTDVRFGEMSAGLITLDEYHADRIQRTFGDFGVKLSFDEAIRFQRTYESYQRDIRLTEGTMQMLDACKASGIPMGILTNGTSEGQWRKVRTLGLLRWFREEDVLVSGEIGVRKPAREAFDYAAAHFGVEPGKCWYVGDSYANDIEPAPAAGWHVVWFNHRGNERPEGGAEPDVMVRSQEELGALVERLVRG